jgi:RNA polymerase sigma-70 factor (ECF subfamily)
MHGVIAVSPKSHHASNDDDSDGDVLRLVDGGDLEGALTLLMQRHGASVYRFCREQLGHDARAADTLQLVFIAAFRDLPRFKRRSSVRTWLFAIARNRALDVAKSHGRVAARIDLDDAADAADPVTAPGERLDDARLHEALVWCVARLEETIRVAVLMRFQQGFTFEHMAYICREKSGTLQARVTRALPQLRACIEARTGGSL